jgi:hypothetical protein
MKKKEKRKAESEDGQKIFVVRDEESFRQEFVRTKLFVD